MVYLLPLISDLAEDLDKALWVCSLEMESRLWIVEMTERAKLIWAFITPFGLFEWLRMPFGIKNVPKIYQRLVDNALYGNVKIFRRYDRQFQERWNRDIPATIHFKAKFMGMSQCRLFMVSGLSRWSWSRLRIAGQCPVSKHVAHNTILLRKSKLLSRFIEDKAIYAAIIYELRETKLHKIGRYQRMDKDERSEDKSDYRWKEATMASTLLKAKIATTRTLRHFYPQRPPVIVVYACNWAVSATLTQEYDGVLARYFHQSNAEGERTQLCDGGEGSIRVASYLGRVLQYVGLKWHYGTSTPFNIGMVDAISTT